MPQSSKYRGVSRHIGKKKPWQVKIKYAGGPKGETWPYHFGYYPNQQYAAMIYDALAVELFGNDATLNFDGKPPPGVCRVDIIEMLRKKGLK